MRASRDQKPHILPKSGPRDHGQARGDVDQERADAESGIHQRHEHARHAHRVPSAERSMFSSMEDLVTILHSLLVDDEKLLKKETAALMFSPQLSDIERAPMGRPAASPVDLQV